MSEHRQPGRDLWVATVTVRTGGVPKRLYAYAPTAAEADAKLQELRQKGSIPATRLTVADLMTQWLADLERQSKLRASTIQRYRSTATVHVVPDLGTRRVVTLSVDDIRAFDQRMETKGTSAPARRGALLALSTALDFAVSNDVIARNVAERVAPPSHRPAVVPAIPIEHALKIISAATNEPGGAMYILALTTGARQGELFGLKRSDIDLKARTMTIERSLRESSNGFVESKPKNGRTRAVALAPFAVEALRDHFAKMKPTGYVFTAEKGGPLRKSVFMRKTWAPFLEHIELPHYSFHQMRHTSASLLASLNIHPTTAAAMLGHSAEVNSSTYAKADLQMQRQAAERLGALLRGGPVPSEPTP